MTPYYEDEWVTIYHGDCREIAGGFEADALITDPPYGTGHYETDRVVLDKRLFETLPRPAAIFGYPERLVEFCLSVGQHPNEWVTWWASNAAIKAFGLAGLLMESECVAIFGPHRFGELRQARTSSSRRITVANYKDQHPGAHLDSHGDEASRRVGDVWTDASPGLGFLSSRRLHPNEKPVTLMRRLVEGLTAPGDVVLDPFMGSGTTLRAAKDLGRKAIGVELEERYCEIAARRMGQEVLAL